MKRKYKAVMYSPCKISRLHNKQHFKLLTQIFIQSIVSSNSNDETKWLQLDMGTNTPITKIEPPMEHLQIIIKNEVLV